uniref:IS200/IS605 family transposase n=1 Tax=Bifidobacterium adolescentis TaxID=1680 RepID=UPI00359C18D5
MRKTDRVKHNRNITYRCHYHVVWCPKYRRKVLTSNDPRIDNPPIKGDPGAVDERLKQIIQDICNETHNELLEIEIMPDHVHLLVDCDPQYGINKLIRLMKGRSSRLLRQEFPSLRRRLPTLWTNSYFVATVGGAPLEIVKQYVENQRNV